MHSLHNSCTPLTRQKTLHGAHTQDEKKLVELERGVKEAEERRPAHQRKVEESEESLAKANEEKKSLEGVVGNITKKRDKYVREGGRVELRT